MTEQKVALKPVMGFRDLLLFYIVTGFSVRWIAQAAHGGPSALVIWIVCCVAFYVPLVVWRPRTWLLSVGWLRHGLIRVGEVPGERAGVNNDPD